MFTGILTDSLQNPDSPHYMKNNFRQTPRLASLNQFSWRRQQWQQVTRFLVHHKTWIRHSSELRTVQNFSQDRNHDPPERDLRGKFAKGSCTSI